VAAHGRFHLVAVQRTGETQEGQRRREGRRLDSPLEHEELLKRLGAAARKAAATALPALAPALAARFRARGLALPFLALARLLAGLVTTLQPAVRSIVSALQAVLMARLESTRLTVRLSTALSTRLRVLIVNTRLRVLIVSTRLRAETWTLVSQSLVVIVTTASPACRSVITPTPADGTLTATIPPPAAATPVMALAHTRRTLRLSKYGPC